MRFARIVAGVALLTALALVGSGGVQSQDKEEDKATPDKTAAAGLPKNWDQLGLTDAQQTEIVKLTREQREGWRSCGRRFARWTRSTPGSGWPS
jgi:hypothetical protein